MRGEVKKRGGGALRKEGLKEKKKKKSGQGVKLRGELKGTRAKKYTGK